MYRLYLAIYLTFQSSIVLTVHLLKRYKCLDLPVHCQVLLLNQSNSTRQVLAHGFKNILLKATRLNVTVPVVVRTKILNSLKINIVLINLAYIGSFVILINFSSFHFC